MNYDRQAALVARLYSSTLTGKIKWEPTIRKDAFEVSFPGLSVILYRKGDDILIDVINREGEIAETFTDRDLDLAALPPTEGSWYLKMCELFMLARRKARGADEALDQILASLDNEEGEGQ